MKNVLIIGAGTRVVGGILPALLCLKETHRVAGVVARTKKKLSLYDGAFETETVMLADVDFASLSLIMVAVTLSEVPRVVRALAPYDTRHITLMLDTPVLPFRGLLSSNAFSRFKAVRASEDVIALPPYLLARSLVEQGAVGALRRVCLFHSGYRYHALASMRMLADSEIRTVRSISYQQEVTVKHLGFRNGSEGVLYEPRDYDRGTFLIEGDAGIITDFAHARSDTRRIGYEKDGARYRGLMLDGLPVETNKHDHAYRSHLPLHIPGESLMNTMKIRGLMELIVAATEESPEFNYPPLQSVTDNALVAVSEKVGYAPNPFS